VIAPVFYRGDFTLLWLTLSSNEALGVLDNSYLEDYSGTDGQVSLYHVETDTRQAVLLTESVPDELTPHEVFTGFVDLTTLPDGTYRVEGRVRDVIGNYAILSEIAAPTGEERVEPLGFLVAEGRGVSFDYGPLLLFGGYAATLTSPAPTLTFAPMTRAATLAPPLVHAPLTAAVTTEVFAVESTSIDLRV
jgi:hypothetical protein